MNLDKRPKWFRFYLASKSTLDQLPDEDLGKAVKSALSYFGDKTVPELDGLALIAFNILREYADEAFDGYAASVAAGHKGADAKKDRSNTPS